MIKFITPCFVRVKDAKKRTDLFKWLFDIGYAGRHQINMANSIIVVGLEDGCVDVVHCNTSDGLAAYGLIDSGENIGLFKALAAMNDENDLNQWYVCDVPYWCDLRQGDWVIKRDTMDHTTFFPSVFHKATVAEIIEHFKKREK